MTTAIVPASPAEIATLPDRERGEVITHALVESKAWLAVATQGTDPTPIAEFKRWAATVAEMTRQKNLAGEIQADAQEMVRRAERGIGVAIRNGQAAGELFDGSGGRPSSASQTLGDAKGKSTVTEATAMTYAALSQAVYPVTDDVSNEQFEDALSEARGEGDMSRANVIRKVQGVKPEGMTPFGRLTRIREMAPTGATSYHIAREVGITPETVRAIARKNSIEITADKVMGNTRRVDSNHIMQRTVDTLDGLLIGIRLVKFTDLDPTQAENWAASLTDSIRALNRLTKQIKEMTQ